MTWFRAKQFAAMVLTGVILTILRSSTLVAGELLTNIVVAYGVLKLCEELHNEEEVDL